MLVGYVNHVSEFEGIDYLDRESEWLTQSERQEIAQMVNAAFNKDAEEGSMIDAYIVRDPQGRVIGISVTSYRSALEDVFNHPDPAIRYGKSIPSATLMYVFDSEGSANVNGYTLTREPVDL
jgi:hypothetical protein